MTLTTASTPRLSEAARHLVYPAGIERSVWPQVRERLAEIGVEFDPWQEGLSTLALGLDAGGKYAATVGGVVVSIPRQVGKTFTVGHLLIGLCLEFPRLRVIWTSHHATTTDNTFESMQALVLRPKVLPFLRGRPRTANGQQRIVFRNGSRIMFGAREHGFGRGMDGIDVAVLDEAQKLSLKALEDIVPATNQPRHRHGALVFFTGTPPRPSDNGEAFGELRRAALDGETLDGIYVEMSADPDSAWDDREQWRKMNPSYPHRTPDESMLRMRKLIPDPDSWRREAMGIWDEVVSNFVPPAIDLQRWRALAVEKAPDGPPVYGVKFSVNGETVALSAAARAEAGPGHVEGVDHRSVVDGSRWLVEFLSARKGLVVIDGKSGAGALVTALRRAGVPPQRIKRPTVDEVIAAHAGFVDAVQSGDLSHIGDPALEAAVEAVVRRSIGNAGGWGFAGRDGEDVTLLESAVLAHFGLAGQRRSGRSGGRRRAVVM